MPRQRDAGHEWHRGKRWLDWLLLLLRAGHATPASIATAAAAIATPTAVAGAVLLPKLARGLPVVHRDGVFRLRRQQRGQGR
eukprot:2813614-Prymnesium_polylepis.1